jgi:hypothetical protein
LCWWRTRRAGVTSPAIPRKLSRHSAEAQTVIWIALPNGLDPPSG